MVNKDDIFAPPTKEELDNVFAPPTKDEVKMFAPPSENELTKSVEESPGMLESLGRGGLQGISEGFSDELGAGITAIPDYIQEKIRESSETEGMDKIQSDLIRKLETRRKYAEMKGDVDKAEKISRMIEKETGTPFQAEEAASFGDIYSERRDLGREANIEAKEAHPITYGAGQFAGTAAAAVAGGLGGLSKSAIKELMKAGGKSAVYKELLKRGVSEGAAMGAIEGAGYSEADLTKGEVGEFAGDVAKTAALGGTIGAATPFIKPAYRLAKQGAKKAKDVIGKGIKELAEDPAEKAARKLADKVVEESSEAIAKNKPQTAYQRSTEGIKKVIDAYKLGKEGKDFQGTGLIKGKHADEIVNVHAKNYIDNIDTIQRDMARPKFERAIQNPKNAFKEITEGFSNDLENLKSIQSKMVGEEGTESYQKLSRVINYLDGIRSEHIKKMDDVLVNQQPKSKAQQKLIEQITEINTKQKLGVENAKAVDRLFNKVVKKAKDGKLPDMGELEQIQYDFGLPNVESAQNVVKEVIEGKIMMPKINPKTGEISQQSKKFVEVIKNYKPSEIFEVTDEAIPQLGFRYGPDVKLQRFRPTEEFIEGGIQVDPQKTFDIQKSLREMIPSEKGEVRNVIGELGGKYRKLLEEEMVSPENREVFKEAMDLYKKSYELSDLANIKSISDPLKKQEALTQASKFVEKLNPTDILESGDEVAIRKVQEIMNSIKAGSGDEFIESAGKSVRTRDLARTAVAGGTPGVAGTGTTKALQALGAVAQAAPVKIGAGVGRTVRGISKLSKVPSNIVTNLSDMTGEMITKLSQQARNQGNESVANFLENLSKVESQGRKKALVFTASQRPEIREFLEESLVGDDIEE